MRFVVFLFSIFYFFEVLTGYSEEHCYKFEIFINCRDKKHVDTVFNNSPPYMEYQIFNCSDHDLILNGFDKTDIEYNGFYCNFFRVVGKDTIPYCNFLSNYEDPSMLMEPTYAFDTIKAGQRSIYEEKARSRFFYSFDTGEYWVRGVWKLKLNDDSGYYYQESENTLHIIVIEEP